MAKEQAWYRLRDGSAEDLTALVEVDGGFSTEWVLALERHGGAAEQGIGLRWRKVKPEGARRGQPDPRKRAAELKELRSELKRSERLLIAEAGGRPVGYLMLGANWNGTAEVVLIIIDAGYRGRGLGTRFVAEAEAFARARKLRAVQWEAQTDNRAAVEFALARGYRIAGFHDGFYGNRDAERQTADDFRGVALFLTKELD